MNGDLAARSDVFLRPLCPTAAKLFEHRVESVTCEEKAITSHG